ncbi:MAG: hypothetical protein ACERKZ_20785 [Lachnotalea sp.]
MKLYKFLLISDDVVNLSMDLIQDGGKNNYHKNSIFALKEEFGYDDIRFIKFRYPNGASYDWAYTIIDTEDVSKISNYKWGTTRDKIGNNHQSKHKPYVNPNRIADEEKAELLSNALEARGLQTDVEAFKQYRYIKIGGWLNNPNDSIGFLHKYLISVCSGDIRVHHKGHTFDNRKAYLKKVNISQHRFIHNCWEPIIPNDKKAEIRSSMEPNEIFHRAEKIVFGDGFSRELECCCCNYDCKQCNGVLLIDTVEVFLEFNKKITSKEYKRLERDAVYQLMLNLKG